MAHSVSLQKLMPSVLLSLSFALLRALSFSALPFALCPLRYALCDFAILYTLITVNSIPLTPYSPLSPYIIIIISSDAMGSANEK